MAEYHVGRTSEGAQKLPRFQYGAYDTYYVKG